VALVPFRLGNQEGEQIYGVQPHHLLICDALGLDHAWYAAPSVYEIDQFSQSPWTWGVMYPIPEWCASDAWAHDGLL